MIVQCPVSLGELLDKLSILRIKKKFIEDSAKLKLIDEEEMQLSKILTQLDLDEPDTKEYLDKLIAVNQKLWTIEDDIRKKESKSLFDREFIELARLVYLTNDLRFQLKKDINEKYGSTIQEVKSYAKYTQDKNSSLEV